MKKHKMLGRVSALTMAAVISTANAAWAYPPLLMSHAESADEETGVEEAIETHTPEKSVYPEALRFSFEDNGDVFVLRFEGIDYIKSYFNVRLLQNDSELARDILSEETVFIPKDGTYYKLKITPKEVGEGGSVPYELDDVKDDGAAYFDVSNPRDFARLKKKHLINDDSYTFTRYEGSDGGPDVYYGEKVLITPNDSRKVKVGNRIIEKPELVEIGDDNIEGARAKLNFEDGALDNLFRLENREHFNAEDNSILIGDTVVIKPVDKPGKKLEITVSHDGKEEKFTNQSAEFKADSESYDIKAVQTDIKFDLDRSANNENISLSVEKQDDNGLYRVRASMRESVEVKSITLNYTNDKGESAKKELNISNLDYIELRTDDIHSDGVISVDYEIKVIFDLKAYFEGMQREPYNEVNGQIKKIYIGGELWNENAGNYSDFEEFLEAHKSEEGYKFNFYVDKQVLISSIEYANDKNDKDESAKYEVAPSEGSKEIVFDDRVDKDCNSYSINVDSDMLGHNEFTVIFNSAKYNVNVQCDEEKCTLVQNKQSNSAFEYTAQPKPGYYVSSIVYYSVDKDNNSGEPITVYSYDKGDLKAEGVYVKNQDFQYIQNTGSVTFKGSELTSDGVYEVMLSKAETITLEEAAEKAYYLTPSFGGVDPNSVLAVTKKTTVKSEDPEEEDKEVEIIEKYGIRSKDYTVSLKRNKSNEDDISGISCDPAEMYNFGNSEGRGFDKNDKGEVIVNKTHSFYILCKDRSVKKVEVKTENIDPRAMVTSISVESENSPLRFLTFGIFGRDKMKVTVNADYVGETKDFDVAITDIQLTKYENGKKETDTLKVGEGKIVNNSFTWTLDADTYDLSAVAYITVTSSGNDSEVIASPTYYMTVDSEGQVDTSPAKKTFNVSTERNDIKTIVEESGAENAPELDISAYFNDENNIVYVSDPDCNVSTSKFGKSQLKDANQYNVYPLQKDRKDVKSQRVDLADLNGAKVWTNNDFDFRIYAADEVSGVNSISYTIGNEKTKKFDFQSTNSEADNYVENLYNDMHVALDVKAETKDELKTFVLKADSEDNCGNTTNASTSMTVSIDRQKPSIENISAEVVDANGKRVSDYSDGAWTNKRIKLTVTANDGEGSGIKEIIAETEGTVKLSEPEKVVKNGKTVYTYIVEPDSEGSVTFSTVDNVDNKSVENKTINVKTETNAPSIVDFVIEASDSNENGRGTDEGAGEPNDINNGIFKEDYGFFFQNDVDVTVSASDIAGESGINSGVDEIWFVTVGLSDLDSEGNFDLDDIDPEKIVKKSVDSDNEATFHVSAGFKGQIAALPMDLAGNQGDYQTPKSVVTETQEIHDAQSSANIILPEAEYKDAAGLPLYDADPTIKFDVYDAHSGIRNIKWEVRSVEDDKVYESGASNFEGANPTENGWDTTKERNIITHAEKSITVSHDENELELWLYLEDNAGFTSEQTKKLSIDKTAPEIVSFDITDSDGNADSPANETYYKHKRKATVKIRERNLDVDKTKELIKIATGINAGTVDEEHSYSGDFSSENTSNLEGEDKNIHTFTVDFDSDKYYEFTAQAQDLTGKQSKTESDKFVIDKTDPTVDIAFDNNSASNGKYYKDNRKATVTIREHNFDPSNTKITSFSATSEDNQTGVDAKEFIGSGLKWTQSATDKDEWTAQISFDKDGKYSFSVHAADKAGNGADYSVGDFYIDKVAPVIEQTFTPGNKERFATNGEYNPTVKFSDYNLFDNGLKCDVKIQKIDINGPASESFTPNSDYHPAESKKPATYENKFEMFGDNVEIDGIYEISISAEDKAGNIVDGIHYTVSINRYGSTYAIVNDEAKDAVEKFNNNNTPVNTEFNVVVREVNVTELEGDSSITVIRDNSEIKSLKKGDYTVSSERTGEDDKGWYEMNYTVGKEFFEDDGNYLINIESNDSAGNKNSNNTPVFDERKCSVVFAIDRTLPEVIISGVENDAKLKEAEADLTITCSDRNLRKANELSDDDLKVKINDLSYNVDDLRKIGAEVSNDSSNNIIISLPVKANKKNSKNDISVEIKDKAGNESLADKSNIKFELAASFFTRHLALSVILIALGVIALGTGGVFVVKKAKNG